jgi:hypothetical protein
MCFHRAEIFSHYESLSSTAFKCDNGEQLIGGIPDKGAHGGIGTPGIQKSRKGP